MLYESYDVSLVTCVFSPLTRAALQPALPPPILHSVVAVSLQSLMRHLRSLGLRKQITISITFLETHGCIRSGCRAVTAVHSPTGCRM
jgi:hypothetical protein